jgi:hypothetical protein
MLVEHFDDYVDPAAVPVPVRVEKYHPAVKAFLDDKEWQYVTKAHLARAARILQAIATEAPKRGIAVLRAKQARPGTDHYRARELRKAHLLLNAPRGLYRVQVREIPAPGGKKVAPRRWNEQKNQPSWIQNRGWEFISTGKLELVVDWPGSRYNGDHYRDAKSTTVEDKLPEMFRSVEIYRLRAEWQKQERQWKEAEKRRRREETTEQAKLRYAQHVGWENFEKRSRDWHGIRRHREFLAAARAAIQTIDASQHPELTTGARPRGAHPRRDRRDPAPGTPSTDRSGT